MPEDALRELVKTGALVPADEVRDGANGEWFTAAEIPNLFSASQLATLFGKPASSIEISLDRATTEHESAAIRIAEEPRKAPSPPLIAIQPPEIDETSSKSATGDEIKVLKDDPEGTDGRSVSSEPEPDATEPFLVSSPPPEDPLITEWKSERARTIVDLGLVSLAAEITQTQDEEQSPPVISEELMDVESEPPGHVAVSQSVSSQQRSIERPAFLDQVTGLEDGPRARTETWEQTFARWRRSLPSWPVVAAACVLLLGLCWMWPRSQRATYDRYVALWNEWKTRRSDYKDREGWDSFLKRVRAELDETVPWLEKHARPTDQDKLVLLFIGRDCLRPMLQNPRMIGTKQEKQLEVLLATAKSIYDPTSVVQSRDSFTDTSHALPSRELHAEALEGVAPAKPATDKSLAAPSVPAVPR
jgi:hypothetical protein